VTRTRSLPLHVVVSREDGLYVVGGAFRERHDAETLAGVLPGFTVVPLEPPPFADGPPPRAFLCQLETGVLRVFELEPYMSAHAVVCDHGPSELVWAADETAARDAARGRLAAATPMHAPAFVAACGRKGG